MTVPAPPPTTGDDEMDAQLTWLENADPGDLDAQIDAAERLHGLLTERLTGEA